MSVDNGLAWINLWQALRKNGFSQFVRFQSQMGREKRENTMTNQTNIQSEHQGEQNAETKIQYDHQGEQNTETKIKSEQEKEPETIPLDHWIAGWQALKRNGFPQFVKWTQLGREKMDQEKINPREPKEVSTDNDLWEPPWGKRESMDKKMGLQMDWDKRDSMDNKMGVKMDNKMGVKMDNKMGVKMDNKMGVKINQKKGQIKEQGKIDPREDKAVSTDNDLWQPPWGKRDSMDQKMGAKMDKKKKEKMVQKKGEPNTNYLENDLRPPPWAMGKMDSKVLKMGKQMYLCKRNSNDKNMGQQMYLCKRDSNHSMDQKMGQQRDLDKRDSMDTKMGLPMDKKKGEKMAQEQAETMYQKTISLDHDLWQTMQHKGQPLVVKWT